MDAARRTMLLASIDHTLATMRAALAAGEDAEQTEEARTELAGRAGADMARLAFSSRKEEWGEVPQQVRDQIESAAEAANGGDLEAAEDELTAAREALGGQSR